MLKFSAEHKVFPMVEEFPFEEFPKAFAHLEKGKPHFRAVVNVQKWTEANGFKK
jgi:uncharacterized zinc-type alcohol dehydrogenase-like protein